MTPEQRKELIEQVIIEATNLKKNATKEELERLDFETLDPGYAVNCIYGQMTGNCYSQRVYSLIKNCAQRFAVGNGTKHAKLNGDISGIDRKTTWGINLHWSPIEIYITHRGENAKLIAFLKDETQTLELI